MFLLFIDFSFSRNVSSTASDYRRVYILASDFLDTMKEYSTTLSLRSASLIVRSLKQAAGK